MIIYDPSINNLARPLPARFVCNPPGDVVELFRMRTDAARTGLAKSPDFRCSFAVGSFRNSAETRGRTMHHRRFKAVSLIASRTGREMAKSLNLRCNRVLAVPAKFFFYFYGTTDLRLLKLLISIANVRRNSVKNGTAESALLGKEVLRSNIKFCRDRK